MPYDTVFLFKIILIKVSFRKGDDGWMEQSTAVQDENNAKSPKAVDKLVSNEENASPDTPDKFKIDLKSNANSDSI